MNVLKPYAKPVVRSVSRQEFCAHCIDAVPVGVFRVEGREFALCRRCSIFLKVKKELPPVQATQKSLSYFNTATYIPDLDEQERRTAGKEKSRASHCKQHYGN